MEGFRIKFEFQKNENKFHVSYNFCDSYDTLTNSCLQMFIPVVYLPYRNRRKMAAH